METPRGHGLTEGPRGLSHFVVPSCSNNVAPGKAGVRSRNLWHVPVQQSFWCASDTHSGKS